MTKTSNIVPVSVCIPVYNGALYIRDAIRSVLNQTVTPQEIIISDSGSWDGSEDIVREEAARAQGKIIILPIKTPGMVANWNSTIRAASGKYIKFLFQDDLLHPKCLEEMVALAESDERIGFVFSPRDLLIEPSAEGDPFTEWLLANHNLSAAFGELGTSQPGASLLGSQKFLQQPLNKIGEPTAVLVRSDLFRRVGLFNERMCQLVDMEMWIRLMAISHVGYISQKLASLRVHPQRASNRHGSKEIVFSELDCLRHTLRTPTIYPLLHWRVRCALRFPPCSRFRLFVSEVTSTLVRQVKQIGSFPYRYAAALKRLRRVRAVAHNTTFDGAFAFADAEIGIVQKRDQIEWLFELVRAAQPRVVLQIGLDLGGTFFLWSRAAAADAHLLAIDTRPPGRLGIWSPFPRVLRGFATGSQRVSLLMGADSHSETVRNRVAALLAGRPVEFLFINGGHSREEVWRDFHMYSALVAPGGLIAFHGVSTNSAEWTQGVARFWREFTIDHETEERVVDSEPGFGIGVYRVPESLSHGGSGEKTQKPLCRL